MAKHRIGAAFVLSVVCASGLSACQRDGSPVSGEMAELAWSAVGHVTYPPAEALRGLENPSAYIPWHCYVSTQDGSAQDSPAQDGSAQDSPAQNAYNSCYTCHAEARFPNQTPDKELQLAYDFPEAAQKNRWGNLFEDQRAAVAAISDESISDYVRQDNYRNGDVIVLAQSLKKLVDAWDTNGDGVWGGYLPDAYFAFDKEGFDRAPDGSRSGWRSYAFYPLAGAFMPRNSGHVGDVLLRLPDAFRQNEQGDYDHEVYRVNLAIVEALSKRADVAFEPVDEVKLGVDLDRDGTLADANKVVFAWAPKQGKTMSYVGLAGKLQQQGEVHLAAGLLPRGAELLHSLRYLDVVAGEVRAGRRMKELRYARKGSWHSYAKLAQRAATEEREKRAFPDRLKQVHGDSERGVSNGQGWVYQGFIEDARGQLRPQSYEETVFCVGCHGGLSVTTDGVFSLARKVDSAGYRHGWYHFSQKSWRGVPEPQDRNGNGEYSFYRAQNGSIDPLREAADISDKHEDMAEWLLPSPARALNLAKAYRVLVKAQHFERGRTATLAPAKNLLRTVVAGRPTGVKQPVSAPLSIRAR